MALTTDVNTCGSGTVTRQGLFSLELHHRGHQITLALRQRSAYRRRRRGKNLRYRPQRINNRSRPQGWLPPSLRHRVDTTVAWACRLQRWAPLTAVHVERVAFDVRAAEHGQPLLSVEYCHGTLHGTEVREYLLTKWNRTCAYCGATGVPLNIEHIRPRSRGGSDRISNLALACVPCNEAKAARPIEEFLAHDPDLLGRMQRQVKRPLRDAATMNATRWAVSDALSRLGVPVHAWSGGRTKFNRTQQGLAKSHTLDALAVGEIPPGTIITRHPRRALVVACTGRGRRQRTVPDRHGFPRLTRPRQKTFFGFTTGDLVRADVRKGKHQGLHTGRVAVRSSGSFSVRTAQGLVLDTTHRRLQLLQRADGYGYTHRKEKGARGPA
jgi:5-methylcytosine-specific restriction endonuclease McrA